MDLRSIYIQIILRGDIFSSVHGRIVSPSIWMVRWGRWFRYALSQESIQPHDRVSECVGAECQENQNWVVLVWPRKDCHGGSPSQAIWAQSLTDKYQVFHLLFPLFISCIWSCTFLFFVIILVFCLLTVKPATTPNSFNLIINVSIHSKVISITNINSSAKALGL